MFLFGQIILPQKTEETKENYFFHTRIFNSNVLALIANLHPVKQGYLLCFLFCEEDI